MSKRLSLSIGLVMLIVASMACSFAGTTAEPTAVPPTTAPLSPPPINTMPAVATFPPIAPQTAQPTVAGEVLPTDTATPTATVTPQDTPKPSTGATARPAGVSSGPLAVRYEVVKIKRNPGNQAIMTLRVIATGGGGGYQYFHDNFKEPGATFDVLGQCGKPFVHTIKVTSASGESVAVSYHEAGTCPPA